ncbi:sperm receptor for egg jelly-like [Cephus cinctus]|uniref:Sperm receptor for egg jelly-like n=1 Tax=Cephus cinctus TaxID=211228 RepID=A0AAJ7W113_CEPCN|nr:sperm receptor for egg jelly-like [Cephus cinctus]
MHDQGIWESAARRKINGNSCKNSGTLLYNNIANRYKCVCEPGYEGANCQLRSHICKEENTTCLKYNKNFDDCVPIQGNGFACYYKNDRKRWCNFKNENSCPPAWTCLDNLIGLKRGYRCLPPGQLKSLTKSEMLNNLWIPQCQNGGRLNECGICVCLESFMGPHCEFINRCKNDPCSDGSTCHSFPGGYVCTCPDHRTGIDCKIIKRRIISTMKEIRLFHHPEQYILIPSTFLYLVHNPGYLPKISIDFSDRQVIEMTQEDFYRIENINDQLINLKFQPIENNDFVAYAINFTHTYSNEGIYNMSFRAWSNNLLIFNSVFPIRVSDPANCTFQLNLKNSAQTPDKATLYHRRDSIDIYASTRVSCPETSLNYHWELFSVPSIFSAPATEFKRTPQNISVHNAEYHASPYTLTHGNYVLVLSVNMVQPISGGLINATTWFQIVKDKIVAHVSGGSFWNVHETEPFEISAFESYHPDLPRETQLNFSWFCSVKKVEHIATDFCGINDFKMISTKPVIHIQDHVLTLGVIYDFMVKVESDTAESSMQNVKIQVVPQDVQLIRINCIQNCKGNMVAINRPLILQALPKIKSKDVELKWDCIRDDQPNLSILRTDDFVVDDDMFIVKARVFRESHRYKITVTAGHTNDTKKDGIATLSFLTVPKFVVGTCTIFPEQGFALFTQFAIMCNNFLSQNAPIVYEAFQYMLPSQEPLLISFNVFPEFSNITLATGLPEMEYITRVVIYATDSTGLMESYVINVTVYPTAAYLGVISEIKLIKTLITSMTSMTTRHIVEADVHAVISNAWTILRAISTMVQRPLNDDDEIFINYHKYVFVEYLSRCKYLNSISMKYAISALKLLIEIRKKHNYQRNNDKVQLILNEILNDPLLHNVSRTDLIDIGVSILSTSHSLIEKSLAEDSFSSHQAYINNLRKYSNLLSHSIVPHESIEIPMAQ